MQTIRVRTGTLAYEERGEGMPLVLLHANGHSRRDFDEIVSKLSHCYRTLTVDWPGFGDSDPPDAPRAATSMLIADVLRDFVEAMSLPPAIFIGNSIGGYAAARLAIEHPKRVAGLVLVDSGGFSEATVVSRLFCHLKGSERFTRMFNRRFAEWYVRNRTPAVADLLTRIDAGRRNANAVAVDAAIWRSFPHPDNDLRADAARIACPTLLVWGKHDPVIRAGREGRTAERCIPGARLVVLDTGHVPFIEAPADFLAVVDPFLSEVSEHARRGAASNV